MKVKVTSFHDDSNNYNQIKDTIVGQVLETVDEFESGEVIVVFKDETIFLYLGEFEVITD